MNKRFMSFGALLLVCAGSYAQEEEQEVKEQQLEEVVVSDSRFQLKRENSGKTVIKITAKELGQNQGRTLTEIINTKSGIEINGSRSNAGSVIGSFIRGGNNRQVLVIIDGIQVSDPSNVNGEYDLRLLSVSQIESVEILKGASSSLYGNAAASAVINITTKNAKLDGVHANFESSMGTNQSQDDNEYRLNDFVNYASVMGKAEKLSFLMAFGNQYTDGLSAAIGGESDPFSQINSNVKLGYQFSDAFNLNATIAYDKIDTSFDNFTLVDADFSSETEQIRFGLSPRYKYNNGSISLNLAINSVDRVLQSSFPNSYDSQSVIGDVFNKYNVNDEFYTIVGVNYNKQKTVFFSEERDTESIDPYLNIVYISDFGLNVNAGARLNNHSEYGGNFIYNLNPSYRIKQGEGYLKFFGSFATSFIAPNLSQLFGPFGANLDLDPETNQTIEGGVEFRPSGKLRLSALYFNRKETDFIDYVVTDFTTFAGEYQNTPNDLTANGAEIELEFNPVDALRISANYTFTERKEEVRLRLPKHKANAVIGYTFNENTFASLGYQYTHSRLDTDFSTFTNIELDSFSLVDLYASHKLNDRLKLFVGLGNILNEDYVEVIGFTTKGRNARVGFSLNL